ncbi:outer membrane beta-barrel protein [Flavobacterium sp. LPB0248]|uniref:outer membrane beta-barrel protein n=1 Tax=Flavobacterium sp. LPB0248 TaxID=2614441 RepID=UPI0015A6E2F7|nr:outer membrane beta-barrel protein [Flavobacterium sp. LPB0248]QLC66426.1 outer membrane beta-barrel protein [Flavobacterium sp. LPB0248]
MENKKEIGKIFKNKLELLDKSPSNNLWASIERDLNKKRKKRLLFWLIPSLLLMGLASSVFVLELKQNQNKPLGLEKDKTVINQLKTTNDQKQSLAIKNNTSQDSVNKTLSTNQPIAKKTIQNSSETKTTIKKSRTEKLIKQSSKLVATTDEYEEYEVVKKYKVIIRKNKTVTTSEKPNSTSEKRENKSTKSNSFSKKTPVISKKSNSKTVLKNPKNKFSQNKISKSKNKKSAIQKREDDSIVPKQNWPIKTEDSEKNNTKTNKESLKDSDNPKIIKQDSIIPKQEKKTTPKREYIEREYPEQKSENEPEFSVSVFYGPAIFGSLSGKSTINESFDDVSKSHPITSHYGVYFKTMYGKYGFKAGFSKINLKISNHLNNQSSINYENMVLSNDAIYNVMGNDEDIRLVQKISYYEIPLEFNYAIKKDETPYGMEAFSGFSVLFSDANQLYLSSNNLKNESIGSTKNLNKMNLSFNLGMGFYYKLNDKFQIDCNPIFKYYLSTFKDYSAPKPYSLSIQSGVTYKF